MQTKETISTAIAEKYSLSHHKSSQIVNDIFSIMTDELKKQDGEVSIYRFGIFKPVFHDERIYNDIRSGEKKTTTAKYSPHFAASDTLKRAVAEAIPVKKNAKKKKAK